MSYGRSHGIRQTLIYIVGALNCRGTNKNKSATTILLNGLPSSMLNTLRKASNSESAGSSVLYRKNIRDLEINVKSLSCVVSITWCS